MSLYQGIKQVLQNAYKFLPGIGSLNISPTISHILDIHKCVMLSSYHEELWKIGVFKSRGIEPQHTINVSVSRRKTQR